MIYDCVIFFGTSYSPKGESTSDRSRKHLPPRSCLLAAMTTLSIRDVSPGTTTLAANALERAGVKIISNYFYRRGKITALILPLVRLRQLTPSDWGRSRVKIIDNGIERWDLYILTACSTWAGVNRIPPSFTRFSSVTPDCLQGYGLQGSRYHYFDFLYFPYKSQFLSSPYI